jgi:hypothetical protein
MLIVTSCDPCKSLDCIDDDYDVEFQIADKQSGEDLVFGPLKVFDKNQIKFYSLQGIDTINYECFPVRSAGSAYDSALNVKFYPGNPATVYLKLSEIDVDTIAVQYRIYNSECCGRITEIEKLRYNDSDDLPGKGIVEIKK